MTIAIHVSCSKTVAKVQKIANCSIYTLSVESITEYFLVLQRCLAVIDGLWTLNFEF